MLHNDLTPQQIQAFKFLANSNELSLAADVLIEQYMLSWASTNLEDDAHRQHLYRMVQAVRGVVATINTIAVSTDIDNLNPGEQAEGHS